MRSHDGPVADGFHAQLDDPRTLCHLRVLVANERQPNIHRPIRLTDSTRKKRTDPPPHDIVLNQDNRPRGYNPVRHRRNRQTHACIDQDQQAHRSPRRYTPIMNTKPKQEQPQYERPKNEAANRLFLATG